MPENSWTRDVDEDQSFTPRDLVAVVAMHAIMATYPCDVTTAVFASHAADNAKCAYKIADAMIEARKPQDDR